MSVSSVQEITRWRKEKPNKRQFFGELNKNKVELYDAQPMREISFAWNGT